ncbi:MAG: betaine-aldehyde dehydrogenase [Candidatus Puniceispirillum sp. TMED52]|nr:betaine-aldehyde dehydrogenase [SAR116 cluster bacterium]OUU43426.1 MAG: betaine-aldehyde dehydrogenase [Candidatus Puniceispirillum sp. TMED52]
MTTIIKNHIAGSLVDGDGSYIDKYYPATGEVIAKVSCASTEMLDEAVAKASEAQKLWAAQSIQERGQIMIRAAHALRDANDELSRLEVQDVGKVYAEAASGDVPSGPDALEYFGAAIMTYTGVQHQWPGAIGYSRRVPLGVCAGIGAWNYPAQIALWKSAPALAMGNAFILKPSEMTPLVSMRIAAIMEDAGLPKGLMNIIHGDYRMGQAICAHPGIAKVSLTGGVDTGRIIMKQSADTLKRVTLELGGKAPLIICADADLDKAVELAMAANFYTAGEVCSNATRVFVHRSIAKELIARMVKKTAALKVGDPMADDVDIGALISEDHLGKVMGMIAKGLEEGAKCAVGGQRVRPQGFENGYFVEPTILTECQDDMTVVRDEIFGPVMSVLVFDDEDEVIRRANATPYGLGAGLVTRDLARAHRMADRLDAGNVWVNTYNLIPPDLPFGGVKGSGFGRESSLFALEGYSDVKATYIALDE